MNLPSILLIAFTLVQAAAAPASHPPLQAPRPPASRPLPTEALHFVDATAGDDAQAGTERSPWKTLPHALTQVAPGDTLVLRAGTFFESVYCAVAGTAEQPITIRAYPGERVIIGGGLPEFQRDPVSCWEPLGDGEYRSTRPYRNLRDVLGAFADSNIGLQTYWHHEDLVATNEFWIHHKDSGAIDPVYCGPGLWYDKQSGRIHCRLAPTHIANDQVRNYRGETDPRKLPLVIAPFASTPLRIDQAMHVRFQDLVFRGGGFNTIDLNFGVDVTFDNLTLFCATYGLRARATGPLRIVDSGFHGGIPPWGFRNENSLRTYTPRAYDPFIPVPGKASRNIARLNTHALLVTEGAYEFDVFYFPQNHNWEISHCEFSDGHDGVYLSGHGIRFHHNHVHTIQDDAIYLSSPAHWATGDIRIHQNLITRSLMAFGCHSRGGPSGTIHIYRNIADLRQGVNLGRPTPANRAGRVGNYHIFLVHGRRLLGIESMNFYHNTFISPASPDAMAHRLLTATSPDTTRRVFNNAFVYLNRYGWLRNYKGVDNDVRTDGNLHWCTDPEVDPPDRFLAQLRESPYAAANAPGWAANSIVADPQFQRYAPIEQADLRLREDSPAAGAGIVLPAEWEDPFRPENGAKPDIGALPLGAEPFTTGRRMVQ